MVLEIASHFADHASVESQRGGSSNAAAAAASLALCQVVEMPLLQPERFVALGIDPPKVLQVVTVCIRLQYMFSGQV